MADILLQRRCCVRSDLLNVSVRRFSSFDLLKPEKVSNSELMIAKCGSSRTAENVSSRHTWYRYTCEVIPDYALLIRHLDDSLNLEDLLGFNHTGNVCVWPSEEILTYYCLKHNYLFSGKSVCELGGGMTCLAGISLAVHSSASRIVLTDGNHQSVSNLFEVIEMNRHLCKEKQLEARVLRWNENYEDLVNQFDWIICADCLFFEEFQNDLLKTMVQLLKPGGQVLILAPSRGSTMDQFMNLVNASRSFTVLLNAMQYDDIVWKLHKENLKKGSEFYDECLHYPRLLHLSKAVS